MYGRTIVKFLKKDYPCVDYVVGTYAKHHFGNIISAVEENSQTEQLDDTEAYKFAPLSYEQGSFTAFVPIMHGCNNFCTYCIVPYVRGRECSRPVDEILKEIDTLSSYGVREITLLGQNVNSYHGMNGDKETNFAELLQIIANHLRDTNSSIGWVRFMSSHPKDLSDEVINVISKEEVLCNHIHLPVQPGSTRILKEMNRRYTRKNYISLVEKIRKIIPNVSLTTDLMMGFPGETEEDFEDTLDVVRKVCFEQVYMFIYSRRVGTPGDRMENQVPEEQKHKRFDKLKALVESQIAENNQKIDFLQKDDAKTNANDIKALEEKNLI